MPRNKKGNFKLFLKGMAMGAADIVPGVSGGTMALISGIYEEFVYSLKAISSAPKVLFNQGIKEAWNHINGNFLLVLVLGIGTSLISLVQFIKYALVEHPILLWSFFFGLILSSTYFVAKGVKKWSVSKIVTFIAGGVLIFYLTSISPAESSEAPWFIFLSGALAICAMILPGISGAFILVLLGKYAYIIEALSDFNFKVIAFFGAGCIAGLLSFSHLLSWMLKRYHDLTIALLSGFMLGSLNKIWPWKKVLEWGLDRHGEEIAVIEENVMPYQFEGDSQFFVATILALFGFSLIFIFEGMAKKKQNAA
jgi:putative membrane protein